MNWTQHLGREVCTVDQPPGTYRFREAKKCPWQPVRIMLTDDGLWHVLINGNPVPGSPQPDPLLIPMVCWRGPFHAIPETEYQTMLAEYRNAAPGTPLTTPREPVDLRGSPPL